jgi:hypothetical protein
MGQEGEEQRMWPLIWEFSRPKNYQKFASPWPWTDGRGNRMRSISPEALAMDSRSRWAFASAWPWVIWLQVGQHMKTWNWTSISVRGRRVSVKCCINGEYIDWPCTSWSPYHKYTSIALVCIWKDKRGQAMRRYEEIESFIWHWGWNRMNWGQTGTMLPWTRSTACIHATALATWFTWTRSREVEVQGRPKLENLTRDLQRPNLAAWFMGFTHQPHWQRQSIDNLKTCVPDTCHLIQRLPPYQWLPQNYHPYVGQSAPALLCPGLDIVVWRVWSCRPAQLHDVLLHKIDGREQWYFSGTVGRSSIVMYKCK